MPKTIQRYPQVVSAAVTQQLYDVLVNASKDRDISMSTIIREALEEFFGLERKESYSVSVTPEQLSRLKELGIDVQV